MSDSLFSRTSQFVPLSDFYKEWSKTVTEICLPRLRESLSSASDPNISAGNVRLVLKSLEWYYEQLNHYAQTEPNTVPYLLFPSWPDSLELQTLFLGDLHPNLLTNLARSFIFRAVPDSGESSSPEMAERTRKLVNEIEWIEGETEADIKRLLEKMRKAQILFMARFSGRWALSQEEQRIVETVAKVAMEDGEAKKAKKDGDEAKNAMEDIFVSANLVRRKVIKGIVEATAKDYHLAALFLESVCKFFAGFKDQAEGFKNSLGSSPFKAQLPTTDNDQLHQPPGQSATHNGLVVVPANDRTLWMGSIKENMDEKYILDLFGVESVGIVRVTITRERFCAFIEFSSWSAADKALKTYRYKPLPGGFGFYQLNWSNRRLLYTVFVYGLSSSLTVERFKTLFATFYQSVQYVRLEVKGSSRRGQVTFADINDWVRSSTEMDGYLLDSCPMVIRDS